MAIMVISSCKHIIPPKENKADIRDTINVDEFTGVKKFYDQERLVKDITYKKGVKEGICHNYYEDGRLKSTIIYSNNLKTDTAKWYYPEGMVYRATPYKDDKINGIQTKYYKSGRKQAELPYVNSLRTPGLKEYYENGSEVDGIPSIETDINDAYYNSHGIVRLILKLSNSSKNVKFYKGSLIDGAFDEEKCKDITISSGMGYIELAKNDTTGRGYVDVIAVYTTRFRNKEIITMRVKLPYNNLI
jgi:hypothetical protein